MGELLFVDRTYLAGVEFSSGMEEGNSVASAAPALRPSAVFLGLRPGCDVVGPLALGGLMLCALPQ